MNKSNIKHFLMKRLVVFLLFLVGVSYVPYLVCSRQSDEWYAGDITLQRSLANGVEKWIEKDLALGDFHTGSAQFNGEWLFGTYMMAAMGFGQSALEHPSLRETNLPLMEQCIDEILSEDVRVFDCLMWGNDPIETLDSNKEHHAAYLGYFNLVLSLHRLLDTNSKYAELNDQITAVLIKRIESSRFGLLQSYPNELYSVDNCAVIGSIGLHGKATGEDYTLFVSTWLDNFRRRCVDPNTGLLIQALDCNSCEASDLPRGSGTALGLYMLAYADHNFTTELYRAMRTHLTHNIFGFGGVREYTEGTKGKYGDIDSGPVVFGFGLSATGFLISGARLFILGCCKV